MKYYNCRVRLNGDLHNETPRMNATAAEVVVLREIHGADAIVALEEVKFKKSEAPVRKDVDGNEISEREYLDRRYKPAAVVAAIGHKNADLPKEVEIPADNADDRNAELLKELEEERAKRAEAEKQLADAMN